MNLPNLRYRRVCCQWLLGRGPGAVLGGGRASWTAAALTSPFVQGTGKGRGGRDEGSVELDRGSPPSVGRPATGQPGLRSAGRKGRCDDGACGTNPWRRRPGRRGNARTASDERGIRLHQPACWRLGGDRCRQGAMASRPRRHAARRFRSAHRRPRGPRSPAHAAGPRAGEAQHRSGAGTLSRLDQRRITPLSSPRPQRNLGLSEKLILVAGGLGLVHHTDHVLRFDHSGWPFRPEVSPSPTASSPTHSSWPCSSCGRARGSE